MLNSKKNLNLEAEALTLQIKERARNLYQTRQMLCTEAVVTALNQGLDGGLSDAQTVAMTAPFSVSMGESGCLCGALSGAVMACGLFIGNSRPYGNRPEIRKSARQLHDAFKATFGSTCCRALTRKVNHNKKAHFQHCAHLTAKAAELAARLILEKQPELMERADNAYLAKRESTLTGAFFRLKHHFSR